MLNMKIEVLKLVNKLKLFLYFFSKSYNKITNEIGFLIGRRETVIDFYCIKKYKYFAASDFLINQSKKTNINICQTRSENYTINYYKVEAW